MSIFNRTKIVISISSVAICLIYYQINSSLFIYATDTYLRETNGRIRVYNNTYRGSKQYLINTRGCYIPNYSRTYKFTEMRFLSKTCGLRAVNVNKISDGKIELNIDKLKMNTYSKGKTYQCCIRFAKSNNVSGEIDLKSLEYSSCEPFQNGSIVRLQEEIVTVSCNSKLIKIYEDAYIFIKKIISSKHHKKSTINSWNVLILGMDTMSQARLASSMPKTAEYLSKNNWLDFPGYQKVGYNTFPNVMSLMTGKNESSVYKACAKGLNGCSKLLMWDEFKKAGYVTAYGEDFLRLPDTFSKFNGFTESPTDHYMRPFFLTGETSAGNYICTKKISSAHHLLDYAYQFLDVYKKYKHYGLFWTNSCSHNLDNNPTLFDEDFVAFFRKIHDNGLIDKTFIFFVGDHGIRYGSMRVQMESYYEERLPMLRMWIPKQFRELFPKQYNNLLLNQERLVTPYDLYLTVRHILKDSQGSNEIITSEACRLCNSLFEKVSDLRSCADAGVEEHWCTCHTMTVVEKNKNDVVNVLRVTEAYLEKKTRDVETLPCTICHKFKLKNILRSHLYEKPLENKIFYIVAFIVEPGNIGYEACVQKYNNEFSVVTINTITPYNSRGSCVKQPNDRAYCVCDKLKKC